MPLYIRDDEVDALATKLQDVTGARSKTEAVRIALVHELERTRDTMPLMERIATLQKRLEDELGPMDPDFDMKKFSDELSAED